MQWARGRTSTIVTGGIIGFITFVFVVSGVFTPKATRGLHEGSVAGTVNSEPISLGEFSRAYNQRVEFFKNMGGGKVSDEQLKAFRIKEGVFQELVRRKLTVQESVRRGMQASDEEVKERIREIPAFQRDGRFDVEAYKQVLQANNYTPMSFERSVREDLSQQSWDRYFRLRTRVSDAELKRQFELTSDKRNLKYALLNAETGRKGIQVSPADVQKYLADAANVSRLRTQFDFKKDTEFKGKTFDQVRDQLARDTLASEKQGEVRKINESLADQVVQAMAAGNSGEGKAAALLKPYGAEIKKTGLVSRMNGYLPGIGDAKDLMRDAFANPSPIDPASGGKAKKYSTDAWVLVSWVEESQKADPAKFEGEKPTLIRELATKKQREMEDDWLQKLQKKASIDPNPSVIGEDSQG